MRIWFTSDHHFGHHKIIGYCNRPFNSVGHMDALLEYHWNNVVQPDDVVYYLGDFAMKAPRVAELLSRLNGIKHLIPGNHDRCHPRIGQKKWIPEYIKAGVATVQTELELEIAGEQVLLQHFPYRDLTNRNQRHHMSRPLDEGKWLIHGHVHDRWQVKDKQINVGVDVWNFEPVSLEAIEQIIKNGPVVCAADEGTRLA